MSSNLNITVSEGRGLGKGSGGDCYVEVRAPTSSGSTVELKCKSINQSLTNPVWLNPKQPNLSTLTVIGITRNDIQQGKYNNSPILINIYDSENKQHLIGSATVALSTALQSRTVSQWFPLTRKSSNNDNNTSNNNTSAPSNVGEVQVNMFLNDPEGMESKESKTSLRLSSDRVKQLQDAFSSKTNDNNNKTEQVSTISSVRQLIDLFKSTSLLETLISSFVGNQTNNNNNLFGSQDNKNSSSCKDLTQILIQDENFVTEIVTDYFYALDVDQNNQISFQELLNGLDRTLHGSTPSNLRLHFQCLLQNSSKSTLSKSEAKKLTGLNLGMFLASMMLAIRIWMEKEKNEHKEEAEHYTKIGKLVMGDVRSEFKKRKGEEWEKKEVEMMREYWGKKEGEEIGEEEFVKWGMDEGERSKRVKEMNGMLVEGGKVMRKSIKRHSIEIWDKAEEGATITGKV